MTQTLLPRYYSNGIRYSTLLEDAPQKTPHTVNALVAFDNHRDDYNGAILDSINDAIDEGLPIFCERRLFMGEDLGPRYQHVKRKIHNLLKSGRLPFDAFADRDSEEQLVILPKPKGFPSGDLRSLGVDFTKMKWISPVNLLYGKSKRASHIGDFFQIFHPHANVRYRFVLVGHGDRHFGVAGLNLGDYSRFLTFLQQKQTDVLYVQTCNAGGVNRTYHPLTPFPVFVESIGEFSSYYDGRSYKVLFDNLNKSLRYPYRLTHTIAGDIFRTPTWIEYWQNLLQLRLANHSNFYPLNEDSSAFVITRANCATRDKFHISRNVRLLEVVVQRVTRPLFLESYQPIFLSLFAREKPLHVFESIHTDLSLLTLFNNTISTFRSKDVGTHQQLFFIKRLFAKEAFYKNVLVVCSQENYKILCFNTTIGHHIHYHPDTVGTLKPYYKPAQVFRRTIQWHLPRRLHCEIL